MIAAVAALHHAFERGAGQAESRRQIDRQHRIPFRVLHAHEEIVARDAGIVDEDVERPDRRLGRGDERFDGFGIRKIAKRHLGALFQFRGQRSSAVAPRAGEHDGRPLRVQRPRDRAAQSAGSPGDQRRLSRKIEHGLGPSQCVADGVFAALKASTSAGVPTLIAVARSAMRLMRPASTLPVPDLDEAGDALRDS